MSFVPDEDVLLQQAVAAHKAGQAEIALRLYRQLLSQQPHNARVLTLLATLLQQQGLLEQALRTFHLALEVDPAYAEAYNNLACLLREQGQLEDALLCLQSASSLKPDYVDAYNNLAAVLCDLDRPAQALQAADQALALSPDSLVGHFNRANALKELCRLADAAAAYRHCLSLNSGFVQAEGNLAIVEMMLGDYSNGLARYESRWHSLDGGAALHRFANVPQWQGQALDQPVLLWTEQGLGDSLQMLRFLPLAAQRSGQRLLLQCHAPLARLLRQNFGTIADVFEIGETLPSFRLQCPFLSLPHVLGITLESLPGVFPYLQAGAAETQVRSSKRRIGLCWQSGAHARDNREQRRKSLPLALLAPLRALADIEFVSLQREQPAPDWMQNQISLCADLADTASLIASLDLVISVDTAVTHLAGALGKPVWLMLKFDGGNFWLDGRDDSPWYPGMRIFRQHQPGQWQDVITAVNAALQPAEPRPA